MTDLDQVRPLGYTHVAGTYLGNGWWPIPIPRNSKTPPPPGTTGEAGVVTAEDVSLWMQGETAWGNLALRHDGTIAIDVDGYDGKPGPDTLAALITECGPLPTTFTSSSRGTDSPSRQYFFRVPKDVRFITNLAGLEICQHDHRYSLVYPSRNPKTHTDYEWARTDSDGHSSLLPQENLPAVNELPLLPEAWIERLRRKDDRHATSAQWTGSSQEWFDTLNPGEPEVHIRREAEATTQPGASFDTQAMHAAVSYLVGCGSKGHPGIHVLLEQLRNRWLTLGPETAQSYSHYAHEFDDSLRNAIRDLGPNRNRIELSAGLDPHTGNPLTADASTGEIVEPARPYSDFPWDARPELALILQNSQRVICSPYALLGVSLMRALAVVPYDVCLKTYKGNAPLNMLFAFLGRSSVGKTITHDHADVTFNFGSRQEFNPLRNSAPFEPIKFSSDAAMADQYGEMDKGQFIWFDPQYRSMIFGFDEVVDLTATTKREGSSIEGSMASAWSGGMIGRATAGRKTQTLPKQSYRFLGYVNVQPSLASVLVGEHAQRVGFTGRFLWLDAQPDADLLDDDSPVVTMDIKAPVFNPHQRIYALPEMDAEFRAFDREKARHPENEIINGIDGHSMLARAKIAVAFAILNGRAHLQSEDWHLAGLLMQHSKRVRQIAIDAVAEAANEDDRVLGRRRAVQQGAAEVARAEEAQKNLDTCYERIATLLGNPEKPRTLDSLRMNEFGKNYRGEWKNAVALWRQNHPAE